MQGQWNTIFHFYIHILFINHLKCDIMAQIEEKQTVEMTAEEKAQFEAFRKEKAKKRLRKRRKPNVKRTAKWWMMK